MLACNLCRAVLSTDLYSVGASASLSRIRCAYAVSASLCFRSDISELPMDVFTSSSIPETSL